MIRIAGVLFAVGIVLGLSYRPKPPPYVPPVVKDLIQSQHDAERIQDLERKIGELHAQLEDAGRECLTPRDADRLRSLW